MAQARNRSPQPADRPKDRILAAAETVFADRGFEATTVRRIAELAEVPVALINYHFGSKLGLYRAIFEKRTPSILDQRVTGLRLAQTETDPARRVEQVVKALIVPMLGLRDGPDSDRFGRILAAELSDPGTESRGIFREFFDPVAQMMIGALADCFPEWTEAEVHWAYQTMLGAMMIVMMDNGRIARLSDGLVSSDRGDEAATHIVAILTAGLLHRARTPTTMPPGRGARKGDQA